MLTRFKKLLFPSLLVTFLLAQFYVAAPVYAEDDDICDGLITGTTELNSLDAGQNFFDAHGGPNQGIYAAYYNNAVNLKVFGLGQGLAPGSRANAACVQKVDGVDPISGEAYEYKIKGYVFNDNLGFISLNCEAGFNDAGEGAGVDCGDRNYGVYISPVGPGGNRAIFGYGWNRTFGWIDFNRMPLWAEFDPQSCDPVAGIDGDNDGALDPCGPDNLIYGVWLAANGDLSGSALSDTAVLMRFIGAKIILPDEELPIVPPVNDPENWCDGKPYICFQVDPYPEKLRFGFEADAVDVNGNANVEVGDGVKVADGNDGYNIHMYIRNAAGNGALDTTKYNWAAFTNAANGLRLEWTDTVKRDQTVAGNIDNALVAAPWVQNRGAITDKPLYFTDFMEVVGDPGHWVTRRPIKSFAPTTDANLSLTSGTDPTYPVKNEEFVHNIGQPVTQPNQLVLKSINFRQPLIANANGATVVPQGPIYPNGKVGMSLKFRPALEVNTLYADDLQDKIVAYRSIPMNFKIGAKRWGNLAVAANARVDFNLAYSEGETLAQPDCQIPGEDVDVEARFDFHFLNNFNEGSVLPDAAAPGVETTKSLPNILINNVLVDQEKDIQAKATLPNFNEANPGGVLPCDTAAAPTLYTKIHYTSEGKAVAYYSNKVPRIAGDQIANPAAVVHGNIFAQMVREIQEDALVQTSGSVNVNIVRDTINENLEKYLDSSESLNPNMKTCTVTELLALAGPVNNFTVNNCVQNVDYVKFVVGEEQVLYFNAKQVVMDFSNATGAFGGNWTVVSADGNIFIDDNIYNGVNSNSALSLISFRSNDPAKYFKTGNVYLAPCSNGVKNVQATIIADGSLFSYNGNWRKRWLFNGVGDLDPANGEPVWTSYSQMVNSLGCQLLIEGAIYSDNTIGGADFDKGEDPKKYLLIGGGKVVPADGGEVSPITLTDRMRAQYYDLNYLRMFRLSIKVTPEGLPVDQKCGKGLTSEDIRLITSGRLVCGPKEGCNIAQQGLEGVLNQEGACDGIDPFNPVSKGGDLVAPRDDDKLADGLVNDLEEGVDFDPVYIFYKAPSKDSFLFSKAGTINIGGR